MDNEVDARLPAGCPTCHGAIAPERVEDQDQEEIGRRVHVTRFRVHIGHCVACGTRVQGRHPSQTSEATGAAAAQVGPEALAFAAILNQEFGLSYGKTVAVRQRGFGLTLTPGGLSQALARLAARCEPTDEHRKAVVRTQPSVTLDETGWRIGGHPAWLHVAATADATVYGIFAGRGVDAAAALIGADYDGGLVRDGWAPYRRCEAAYHQTCTQHLINRCDALIRQATPAGAGFPEQIKAILQQGLRLRDRYAAGTGSVHGLAVATGRLERSWPGCWTDAPGSPTTAAWPIISAASATRCSPTCGAQGWRQRTTGASTRSVPPWSRARSGAVTARPPARTRKKS